MEPAIPMQRAGEPAEVAAAILWLASPEAAYVTGTFLDVTGGR
jgi:NAD(P)-dependent dehydrogenase (short-subunit alcohol dehydrogenase family)